MNVFCVFSLESPHQGDSNEYTQYTSLNIKRKITPNYPKYAAMGFSSKRINNEFETTMVNEQSVFEPLKFYCTLAEYMTSSSSSKIVSAARSLISLSADFICFCFYIYETAHQS